MAISGSGGWTPSFAHCIRDRKLYPVGFTQNKPKECVFSVEEALQELNQNPKSVIITDARSPNFELLLDALFEAKLIDRKELF